MTYLRVVRDFAEWCTIPGMTQIVFALDTMTRWFWILTWGGMFGVTVYEMYIIAKKFFSNPSQVDITLAYSSMPFVVYTICNINPYKYSVIESNPLYADMQTLMDDYMRVVDANYGDIENDHFGFNQASSMYEKEQWAATAQLLIANQLPAAAIRNATYTFDEFIMACYYNGNPCNRQAAKRNSKNAFSSDFTTFYDASYGACFQYNGNSDVMVYRAGNTRGLRLMAFAAQEDPDGNLLALPTTKTAGVRVGLSYSPQWMEMESYGLDCPNGAETMLSMQRTEIQQLKKPYGQCVDSGPVDYYTKYNYSTENCIRSCIQQQIIASCGCGDPRYQKPQNASFCGVSKVACIRNFWKVNAQTERNKTFDPLNDCGCNPACGQFTIDAAVSFANFPPKAYKVLTGRDAGQEYACDNPKSLFGGNVQKCIQWYKENAAIINVWYDGLDYEQDIQNANYKAPISLPESSKLSNAANDLGGQLGLWVGLSVASVVEVAVLILISIMYCISGRKQKIDVQEVEVQVDPRAERIKQLRDELDEHERIANQLREAILTQAEQEEQMRIARAQHEAAVKSAAEEANAAAVAGQPIKQSEIVLPGQVPR